MSIYTIIVVKTGMKISMPRAFDRIRKAIILCKPPIQTGNMNIKAICLVTDLKISFLLTPSVRNVVYFFFIYERFC